MKLRTEREHGLHIRTNNKLYIQHFYKIHSYEGRVLSKDGLRIWEHPNLEYAWKSDGPQHLFKSSTAMTRPCLS